MNSESHKQHLSLTNFCHRLKNINCKELRHFRTRKKKSRARSCTEQFIVFECQLCIRVLNFIRASRRLFRREHQGQRQADWTRRPSVRSAHAQTTSYNLISHIAASVTCGARIRLYIIQCYSHHNWSRVGYTMKVTNSKVLIFFFNFYRLNCLCRYYHHSLTYLHIIT